MTIRNAIQRDEECLKGIIGLSFPKFFRFFATRSLTSEGLVLVSETEGRVVGFAKMIEFEVGVFRLGCVLWLAVHPVFRRHNIATSLVEAGTDYLFMNGAEAVFASIQRGNLGSLATFRKAGFARVGIVELCRLFGWRVFSFYRKIWYAPNEAVLMHNGEKVFSPRLHEQ